MKVNILVDEEMQEHIYRLITLRQRFPTIYRHFVALIKTTFQEVNNRRG